MNLTERFEAYAAAFEETFADDDWSRLEPYFTEDTVYDIKGEDPFRARVEGRAEVLAHLKESLNGFDRLFDKRELVLRSGPRADGDTVEILWKATYGKDGAPDLTIQGSERASFRGDRIVLLEDVFEPGSAKAVGDYMAANFG